MTYPLTSSLVPVLVLEAFLKVDHERFPTSLDSASVRSLEIVLLGITNKTENKKWKITSWQAYTNIRHVPLLVFATILLGPLETVYIFLFRNLATNYSWICNRHRPQITQQKRRSVCDIKFIKILTMHYGRLWTQVTNNSGSLLMAPVQNKNV